MARSTTEALWRERIAAQARSGLSALAYCAQKGLSPRSFYAWRRRFTQEKLAKRLPMFVPVELPALSVSAGSLRIELPGGAIIVLPADASQERLVTLLRAVLEAGQERPAC